jgi:hypothetical protein
MKDYVRPEAELILFVPQGAVAEEIPDVGTGVKSNDFGGWSFGRSDDNDRNR